MVDVTEFVRRRASRGKRIVSRIGGYSSYMFKSVIMSVIFGGEKHTSGKYWKNNVRKR